MEKCTATHICKLDQVADEGVWMHFHSWCYMLDCVVPFNDESKQEPVRGGEVCRRWIQWQMRSCAVTTLSDEEGNTAVK